MLIRIIIFIFLIFNQDNIYSQTHVDTLLIKLNKLNKLSQLSEQKIEDIFVNQSDKSLDLGNRTIPLKDFKAIYKNDYNPFFKKNIPIVEIICRNNENCILTSDDNYVHSTALSFKSKKACYAFINLLEEIKKAL